MNHAQKYGTVCRWLRVARETENPHIARMARAAFAMEWRGRHIVSEILVDAGYCLDRLDSE